MPTGRDRSTRLKALEDDVEELDLKTGHISETNRNSGRRFSGTMEEATIRANSPRSMSSKSAQRSPAGLQKTSQSPIASEMSRSEHEEVVGGEITVKLEPGQPPKLARSSSQKIWTKPSQLFNDYPSRTEEAQSKFDVIPACIYGSKYMGSTEHGMDCDCTEEWGKLAYILTLLYTCSFAHKRCRQLNENQRSMRRGLGLHQSCDKDRVYWGLRVRPRVPKPTLPATPVCQCHSHPDRKERIRLTWRY